MNNNKKTALIIIDVQNQFLRAHSLNIPGNISDFVNDNRKNIKLVARCSYINNTTTICYQDGFTACMPETYSAALCENIKNVEPDLDMQKSTFAIPDQLVRLLTTSNFEQVFLCGYSTNCCVLASMFKLYDNNINVYMISDLCHASTLKNHRNGIECAQACFGKERVIESQDAVKMFSESEPAQQDITERRIEILKHMESIMSLSKSPEIYNEWNETLPLDSRSQDFLCEDIAKDDIRFQKCCQTFTKLLRRKEYNAAV